MGITKVPGEQGSTWCGNNPRGDNVPMPLELTSGSTTVIFQPCMKKGWEEVSEAQRPWYGCVKAEDDSLLGSVLQSLGS